MLRRLGGRWLAWNAAKLALRLWRLSSYPALRMFCQTCTLRNLGCQDWQEDEFKGNLNRRYHMAGAELRSFAPFRLYIQES